MHKLSVGLSLFALSLLGCGSKEYEDEAFGVVDLSSYYTSGSSRTEPAGGLLPVSPVAGYSQGDKVEVYDFGAVAFQRKGDDPHVAPVLPMYFFFDKAGNPLTAEAVQDERTTIWWMPGGSPTLSPNPADEGDAALPLPQRRKAIVQDPRRGTSAHQRPIVDVGPEALSSTYTGLWEIIEVTVPNGYKPDAIKSWKTLSEGVDEGEFSLARTGKVINCPLIEERTPVVPSLAGDSLKPIIEVWYRRKKGMCFLADGWETLYAEGGLIPAGQAVRRLNTFPVVTRETNVRGKVQTEYLVPIGKAYTPLAKVAGTDVRYNSDLIVEGRPRRTDADPAFEGGIDDKFPEDVYTPIRWYWDVTVPPPVTGMVDPMAPPPYTAGSLRTIASLPMGMALAKRSGSAVVKNVALIGSMPSCGPKAGNVCSNATACAERGLVCNTSSCLCETPTVGYGERCGPTIARCRTTPADDNERGFAPSGYVCHPKEPWGFCMPKCDSTNSDKDRTDNIDARCSDIPGLTCVNPGLSASKKDDKKESVCLRTCNLEGGPEAITNSCRAPLLVTMPAPDGSGPVETDVASRWRCTNMRTVTGCAIDVAFESP